MKGRLHSVLHSSYFDEIYHPRTALEHLNNVYPYEVSHPPLGKLIISLGILMFGMTPFGWRFMGTLFGVLMLPVLYVFLKNLFGKTPVALCGTCLFAFDFMHLVQTRIATIDTYGVFFILVSYYFMYRWLTVPAGTLLRKSVPSLFLCGLFWGIGCASKWTVVYAGAGLALLWLLGLIFKGREWRQLAVRENSMGLHSSLPRFGTHVAGTIALSVVFFILIPVCIYVAAYLPYATAAAARDGTQVTLQSLLSIVWDNQVFMLTYHQGRSPSARAGATARATARPLAAAIRARRPGAAAVSASASKAARCRLRGVSPSGASTTSSPSRWRPSTSPPSTALRTAPRSMPPRCLRRACSPSAFTA